MIPDNPESDSAEGWIFAATITPQRSLSYFGFVLLMSLVGFVSFLAGMVFLLMGAWPVFGFFGLDVLLLYWAFRMNYRAARAYEEVFISVEEMTVRKVSPRGRVEEWKANPLWVRLEKIVHAEYGIEHILLVAGGRKLAVAGFLGPDEKASFASALSNALNEARRGPARTVI